MAGKIKGKKQTSIEPVPVKATPPKPRARKAPRKATAADQDVTHDLPVADAQLEQKLAAGQPGAQEAAARVFQIYYEPWQRELLDPFFSAYDNSGASSELLEFAVFEKLARTPAVKEAKLWGALSWRFTEKTGMTGQELLKVIESNPGHDVYFCNPIPTNEALFHNMWLQGETCHPQFMVLVRAVFEASGLPAEALISIDPAERFSAANYFVGSAAFWDAYLPWINSVLSRANKKLPAALRNLLHSPAADDRGLHGGATYVPFIVERLFAVFMQTEGAKLRAWRVALPERERELNVHLKLLREMRDVAHRTRSAWLAACWVNYRNLYLTQINGKAWCQKYLRTITPTEIRFS